MKKRNQWVWVITLLGLGLTPILTQTFAPLVWDLQILELSSFLWIEKKETLMPPSVYIKISFFPRYELIYPINVSRKDRQKEYVSVHPESEHPS